MILIKISEGGGGGGGNIDMKKPGTCHLKKIGPKNLGS